ncbi:MAG: hypothetical protein HC860_09960, partial [Alkalinema sp. RU_4_3]|nr:hypothetical protein [Alkalinema sp. RU_4_3]
MQLQISSVDKPRLGLHILAVTTLLFALGAEAKAEVKTEVRPDVAGPLNPPSLGDFETDLARKSPSIGGVGGGSGLEKKAIRPNNSHDRPNSKVPQYWG